VRREDVVWTYSGVRPLYDDGASKAQEATRDYVLTLDEANGEAPLLSIFGGKITTFRRLAEAALAKLAPRLPMLGGASWSGTQHLPGGDFPRDGFDAQVAQLQAVFPWLPGDLARRLMRTHGTIAHRILAGARSMADLGRDFGGGLTEREVNYFVTREWARDADDILWRRTKLGLKLTPDQRAALAAAMPDIVRAQGEVPA
jgi:glycerol-3-phosphate dehydrogenase